MCFARVPLAPGDGLAGNQSLPPHRPLATLPTSVHRRPLASRPILSPHSMSVCLCLFSMQNVVPVGEGDLVDVPQDSESQLQEQEKRIEISCTLATEASRRGRMLSGERGRASLLQGHRLTRCRGGSLVLRGGQGERGTGPGRLASRSGEHLWSARYCARRGGCRGARVATRSSEPG